MNIYWYQVKHGLTTTWFETYYLESNRYFDFSLAYQLESLVEDCASDFFYNNDGWECKWPLIFCILQDEDGPVVATFEIEMETEPVFYATKRDPA